MNCIVTFEVLKLPFQKSFFSDASLDKGDNISLWAACNSSFSMRSRTANGAC